MSKITVTLGTLDKAIEFIENYKTQFDGKVKLFIERLGKIGVDTAQAKFSTAQYDGKNDVKVLEPYWEQDKLIVKAVGNATLFIEFGSGVHYTAQHELADKMGMRRGEYGKGRGKKDEWAFYGESGTNGRVVRSNDKGDLILTHGNPPARAMYEAAKQIRLKILEAARSVFND